MQVVLTMALSKDTWNVQVMLTISKDAWMVH